MEPLSLENTQIISRLNYQEEIKSIEEQKINIFELFRKKRENSQIFFNNFNDLEGDFNDIEKMILRLDPIQDQEAIKDLSMSLFKHKNNHNQFKISLEGEKRNENAVWEEILIIEDNINQIIQDLQIKINEAEDIEDIIISENNYLGLGKTFYQLDKFEINCLEEDIIKQEQKINRINSLYQEEINELELLSHEIKMLTKKKEEKERDLQVLQEEEEYELQKSEDNKEMLLNPEMNENIQKD